MLSKLLAASIVVIGLLLAGVQKGSADQIYACKDNASGILYMYATPPATCGPGRTLLTLAFGPGSALGASAFSCKNPGSVTDGGSLSGSNGYTAGVTFGSGVTYTPPGSTFVLQPGIYLVDLNAPLLELGLPADQRDFQLFVNVLVNATKVDSIIAEGLVANGDAFFTAIGNELLQISAPNTVVSFNMQIAASPGASTNVQSCRVIFTRLQ